MGLAVMAVILCACTARRPASNQLSPAADADQIFMTATAVLPVATRARPRATAVPAPSEAVVPTAQQPDALMAKPQSDELVSLSYKWFYRTEWTWETQIPRSLYDYYKQLPRLRTTNYSVYVSHPLDDEYIALLADEIKEAAAKAAYTDYETVEFATAFVQSLPVYG